MNKKEKKIKFANATESEISELQKLIKDSITCFNDLEDLSSLIDGKFSKENKFSLNSNSYLNQIKVKLIIDFLDIMRISSLISKNIAEDFIRFHKLTCDICKSFLITREPTFRDSAIFINLIILNYPFYTSIFGKKELVELNNADEKKGQLIGFNYANILSVKKPIYRLWSKKCFFTCECNDDKKFIVKYANIYKPDNSNNLTFYQTYCKHCKKPYHTDKNSELLIESQEIILLLPTEKDTLFDNRISLWLYGEMINSIKEGEKISFLSYYSPYKTNNFHQKDYSLGSFVAVNINIFFEQTRMIKNPFYNFELIIGNNRVNRKNASNVSINNQYNKHFVQNNSNQNVCQNKDKRMIDYINEQPKKTEKNVHMENAYNKRGDQFPNINFNSRFNENSEINILRSISFCKQISSAFFNFIYIMYLGFVEKAMLNKVPNNLNKHTFLKNIENNENFSLFSSNIFNFKNYNDKVISNVVENVLETKGKTGFNFFIQLACKLSIIQREYYSKMKQFFFLNNCMQNIENFNKKNQKYLANKNNKIEENSNKTNKSNNTSNNLSRSVIFKTKIFETRQREKIHDDYKKYFKFARQGLNEYNNSCDLLMKPLNLLFIFDEISIESLSQIYCFVHDFEFSLNADIKKQNSQLKYNEIISIYPYFFPNKLQKESIITYLKINNNKIIIIPDVDILSKYELEVIGSILGNNINLENNFYASQGMDYNITFWFVCSYKKLSFKEKKNIINKGFQDNKFKSIEMLVKNCEIIINMSDKFNSSRGLDMNYFEEFYKNKNKRNQNLESPNIIHNNIAKKEKDSKNKYKIKNENFIHMTNELVKRLKVVEFDFSFDEIQENLSNNKIDKIISNFDFDFLLAQKNINLINILKKNFCKEYHYFGHNKYSDNIYSDPDNKLNINCNFNDSFSSSKLLEDYFLIKRNVNRVEFNDIVNFIFSYHF